MQVGVFIYDRSKDTNASSVPHSTVRSGEPRTHESEAPGPGLYPRGQVTRLIMETGGRDQEEEEVGDRRTPVDLQDIVEKLNTAIRDAKSNMNTMDADLSPIHHKNSE